MTDAKIQSAIDLSVPFGARIVQQGLASQEQVDEAVKLQEEMTRRGVFLRLGELLVARGVVSEDAVKSVLKLQGTAILVCGSCYGQYNVVAYQAEKRYRCQRCHEILTEPALLKEVAVEDTLVADEWREAFELDSSEEGERTLGDYTILGRISRGGMGIIYKARQRRLDRLVAMKVLITPPDRDVETSRANFEKEAQAVAKLRHPYIVAVHDVGHIGGVHYFTMDYVEGLPINRAVTAEGLEDREIVSAMALVCDAVAYVHSSGLLHRDIKPENILLDKKRRPVLIDFGISRDLDAKENEDVIVGSPAYLPPEYITGERPYDACGEVYALGATLYAILAGRPPRGGVDTAHILRSATLEPVKPIRRVRGTIQKDLASIVMTAVAQDPRNRYESVTQLATDLRRWLEGDEITGRPGSWARLWARVRGQVAATVGLAVALLLPLVVGYFTWQQGVLEKQLKEETDRGNRERKELHKQVVTLRLRYAQSLIEDGKLSQAKLVLERIEVRGLDAPQRAEVEAARKRLGESAPGN